MHPQELVRQFKTGTVLEGDLQDAGFLVQADFGWFRCVSHFSMSIH
jgi:hypothetical protein